uniref:Uncharacterized protein n=1 Tax=Opuntia streptacantha TaxID=393608 RepID=A0A7C9F010_OPUST
MEREAVLAPRSPPETGASTAKHDFSDAAEAISTAREGSEVVMSMRTPPERRVERAPELGSSRTERTSEGKPTMEKTTSDWAATSAGEWARWAPESTKGWALERVRVKTVTV